MSKTTPVRWWRDDETRYHSRTLGSLAIPDLLQYIGPCGNPKHLLEWLKATAALHTDVVAFLDGYVRKHAAYEDFVHAMTSIAKFGGTLSYDKEQLRQAWHLFASGWSTGIVAAYADPEYTPGKTRKST